MRHYLHQSKMWETMRVSSPLKSSLITCWQSSTQMVFWESYRCPIFRLWCRLTCLLTENYLTKLDLVDSLRRRLHPRHTYPSQAPINNNSRKASPWAWYLPCRAKARDRSSTCCRLSVWDSTTPRLGTPMNRVLSWAKTANLSILANKSLVQAWQSRASRHARTVPSSIRLSIHRLVRRPSSQLRVRSRSGTVALRNLSTNLLTRSPLA